MNGEFLEFLILFGVVISLIMGYLIGNNYNWAKNFIKWKYSYNNSKKGQQSLIPSILSFFLFWGKSTFIVKYLNLSLFSYFFYNITDQFIQFIWFTHINRITNIKNGKFFLKKIKYHLSKKYLTFIKRVFWLHCKYYNYEKNN